MTQYAIIQSGGKQYNVKPGDLVKIERLAGLNEGDTVELETLAVRNGEDFKVGTPHLDGKVAATVVGEGRNKKVIVFKSHRRQQYRRTNGHRQIFHTIRIDSIPEN